jgi:hypothetical protein
LSRPSRRHFLQGLAAGAACLSGFDCGEAAEPRVARLIAETQGLATVLQRIDAISAALRGTRYQANTLIGGPRKPEQFVLRDDAFDCVTFCETVLAAARAHDAAGFENTLRDIRYRHGYVNWFERNHYFFEWCQHNVDNKSCRWVDLDGAVDLAKTVNSQKGLSKRRFAMRVIPREVLLASADKPATGDIIGFVSRRPDLDYFHCGFVVRDRALTLRHASESHRKVLDERLADFLARYRVRYVTLVRPQEIAVA